MDNMRRCVLTFLDLIGMRDLIANDRHQASAAMERLDGVCYGRCLDQLKHHDHLYAWNDSVLLLSYLEPLPQPRALGDVLREVSDIKEAIDAACGMPSYAIVMKGMTFQPNALELRADAHYGSAHLPAYHYIRASSMALANTEVVQKEFPDRKYGWYVEKRVVTELPEPMRNKLTLKGKIVAFPELEEREIYTADGYLHR